MGMAIQVSGAMFELTNLINAAKWHRTQCMENPASECNVALYGLGLTAKRLVEHCWLSERNTARRMIAETDWS